MRISDWSSDVCSSDLLLESCIERIEAVNPAINAVVTKDYDRARKAAKAAEDAVMRGEKLGALHGLPMGVKDLTNTAGMRTTYGSLLYQDFVPGEAERRIGSTSCRRRVGQYV